jgi:hypothetical protein
MRRPASTEDARPQDFWAITSYFNPVGYRGRLANYHAFRERLKVPLVAVELAYGSRFELVEGDADILIQLRGADVMWHKERLLNVALKAVPGACRKVAWLDCDILFESDAWAEAASRLLDRMPLVQLFGEVHYMPRGLPLSAVGPAAAEAHRTSIGIAVTEGLKPKDYLDEANHRVYGRYAPGFAWAARRDLIERHGFYDGCIVGGGDRALVSAASGHYDHVIGRHRMTEREVSPYMEWAEPFHDTFNGASGGIGCVGGNIFHLWHGALENRRLRERHQGLSRFRFNPREDIAVAENATWHWNSDKPDMHAFVRDHFVLRREDG